MQSSQEIIKDKYMGKTSIEGNKYRGATSIEGIEDKQVYRCNKYRGHRGHRWQIGGQTSIGTTSIEDKQV